MLAKPCRIGVGPPAIFIANLSRLPQTLCHHDAVRSNLIARRRPDGATEIVAIDWESTGPGAVGAEIATPRLSESPEG